ncbi:hypothetical protein RFI_28694 [Reticulomyxa filosa]|uniref:Uncharacterized protein n=1 Tax=Reticulomyxa filosa TaxID=46433 RepID=X6M3Y6_RETFI|nr:hypothetical protein RFI_28694 [Reticulomyxa filosa]|eukprot:ETO08693.1 hypothetical protein RFI_28694 [Reticulomyxa filosa]
MFKFSFFFFRRGLIDREMGVVSLKVYFVGLLLFCVLNIIFFRDILLQLSKESDMFAFYQLGAVIPVEEKPETVSPLQIMHRTGDDQNITNNVSYTNNGKAQLFKSYLSQNESHKYDTKEIGEGADSEDVQSFVKYWQTRTIPDLVLFGLGPAKSGSTTIATKLWSSKEFIRTIEGEPWTLADCETPEQLLKRFETAHLNGTSELDYRSFLRYRSQLKICSRISFLIGFHPFPRSSSPQRGDLMNNHLGDGSENNEYLLYQRQTSTGSDRQLPSNDSQLSGQMLHFNFRYTFIFF